MIVATAGHVDHGKTSLVRALTGIDTDRLEEEKRRGLTIDLGFAYADLGGPEPTGFVDVPGHDRFVRNMLAGVCAIDLALLVIAADDGPMPQTREHLAILELLGAASVTVVLTKIDRVSTAAQAQAVAAIGEMLAPTRHHGAPLFAVSAPARLGLTELSEHLRAHARGLVEKPARGHFRLAIDRSFSVAGAGLIVTGVVLSGQATVGDSLIVSPQGTPVRVRAIHAQNRPAEVARAGQRCAMNLAGADLRHADIARGQWLLAPAAHAPTVRLDARLSLLADAPRALAHFTPVQLHIGAAAVPARVALLDAGALEPGAHALAQLILERPIAALIGDRFVIRDPAAQRTLGGGRVLDPFAPSRGRGKPARLRELSAISENNAQASLQSLLDLSPAGILLEQHTLAWNLAAAESVELCRRLTIHTIGSGTGSIGLAAPAWARWRDTMLECLASDHAEHPDQVGPIEQVLSQSVSARIVQLGEKQEMVRPAPPQLRVVAAAAIRSLTAAGLVVRDGICLRLPTHQARLSAPDAALLEQIVTLLEAAGLRPPIAGEVAAALGLERTEVLTFARRMAVLGHLMPVAPNRFFLPKTLGALADVARGLAGASPDGSFDAASYRDAAGIGRNLTIDVLEFLDRAGVTRFVDKHRRRLV